MGDTLSSVFVKPKGIAEMLSATNKLLFIKQGTTYYKVNIDDITYIESDNVYIRIHLVDNKFLVRNTIDQYLEILGSRQFFKVHRSYAINVYHIQYIDLNHVSINNVLVPISKTYRGELLNNLRLG
jgi:two-component system, LytTR family, response regulator LytT